LWKAADYPKATLSIRYSVNASLFMLNQAWFRRTGKRWIKETSYLRSLQLLWPDLRLWTREPGTLPSFLVIGAQRAGSTFLHDHLSGYTSAENSPLQKEVHYFDNKYYRSLRWYSKFFLPVRDEGQNEKTFETSPYYIYHPAVPKRVKESLPDVKLVAILRDPVDRAVSQYKWMRQIGLETRTAEKAFRRDADRLNLEVDSEYLARFENPLHFDSEHIYQSYLRRSLYHLQLKRWLRHFSPSQLRIVSSESLFERTHEVIEELASFLELRYSGDSQAGSVNRNSSRSDIPVSAEAYAIAEEHLDEVASHVENVVSEEMLIGNRPLLQ
jgi:hypothetical protein